MGSCRAARAGGARGRRAWHQAAPESAEKGVCPGGCAGLAMSPRPALLPWMLLAVAACTVPNPDFSAPAIGDASPSDVARTADRAPEAPVDAAARDAPEDLPGEPDDAPVGEPVEVEGGPDRPTGRSRRRHGSGRGRGLAGRLLRRPQLRDAGVLPHRPAHRLRLGPRPPGPRLPVDDFSIRWTGEITPRYSEVYTFHADHDDGVRLWVGGTAVIDRWGSTGQDTQGQISLTAGQRYAIRLEHFDLALTATMRLSWSSASQAKELVPSTRLHTPPCPSPRVSVGLAGPSRAWGVLFGSLIPL